VIVVQSGSFHDGCCERGKVRMVRIEKQQMDIYTLVSQAVDKAEIQQ